jgi:Putative DNA-binding domain
VPTLREVQAAFAHGVLDPSLASAVAGGIVGAGIAPEHRLAIYRNNVLLSLRRVLEGAFPASRRLLDPGRFTRVAQAFIRSAPPQRPQLMAYGADFPAFLGRSAEAVSMAYVADVARLEWARQEAYYAEDARPLSATELAAVPIARYAALRFKLHPSLRLVRSAGPVFALWRTASAGPAEADLSVLRDSGPEQVLVLRPEMLVTARPISAADLLLLEGLRAGLPLAEAAVRAQAADAGFDLQTALALHLASGSFASCG